MLWSEEFETGVAFIDTQHKDMFARLEILYDREQSQRVAETLDFLGDYVLKHFGGEEMLMRCSKYPQFEEHRQLHEDFVQQFTELKTDYEKGGENLYTLIKITKTVEKWLMEHIMEHDKAFFKHLKNHFYQPTIQQALLNLVEA